MSSVELAYHQVKNLIAISLEPAFPTISPVAFSSTSLTQYRSFICNQIASVGGLREAAYRINDNGLKPLSNTGSVAL